MLLAGIFGYIPSYLRQRQIDFGRESMKDFLEFVVKRLVDYPEAVSVKEGKRASLDILG
jgi:hypothetical protein